MNIIPFIILLIMAWILIINMLSIKLWLEIVLKQNLVDKYSIYNNLISPINKQLSIYSSQMEGFTLQLQSSRVLGVWLLTSLVVLWCFVLLKISIFLINLIKWTDSLDSLNFITIIFVFIFVLLEANRSFFRQHGHHSTLIIYIMRYCINLIIAICLITIMRYICF